MKRINILFIFIFSVPSATFSQQSDLLEKYRSMAVEYNHDLKAALDVFSPYLDEKGRVVPYWHHETWHDDNGSSHIKAALLSPFITVPFVNGKITVGPWQNLTLIECDTRDRVRDIVFQVMGE
mgnify:FL=1